MAREAEKCYLVSLLNADRLVCLLQADINDKMRAILLDWLVEVHQKFKVLRNSLRPCQ